MKKLLAIVLMVAMVFCFAGCGASDEAGSDAQQGDTIKIGVVLPFSGASEYVGNAQYYGYQYALNDFMENYGDKLGGKTIELVTADSTGVADTGVSELERLVNEEGISAVIGTYNSAVAAAMAPVAIKYGIPFMATNATSDTILSQESKYVYRTNMGDADATTSYQNYFTYLRENGATLNKIAFVYEASDYGQGMYNNISKNVCEPLGIEVVLAESFEAGASDLSTIVNKVKASGADMVMVAMYDNDALLFTRQMEEYGCDVNLQAYGGGFIADNYIEQAGALADQKFVASAYIFVPSSLSEECLAIGDKFAEESGYPCINEPFANGWLGMYSLLMAIAETNGSDDSEAIADALNGLELPKDARALLFHPTMDGVKYGHEDGRYNQNIYAGLQFSQVLNNEYTIIFPASGEPVFKW